MCDSYEIVPHLLSRWKGGEDFKNGVKESLGFNGEIRQILQSLEANKIAIDEAVSKIITELDIIHKRTHNK